MSLEQECGCIACLVDVRLAVMSDGDQSQPVGENYMDEEQVYSSNVAVLKSMGVEDEERIREVLQQTGNTLHDAVQLFFPETSPDSRNVSSEMEVQVRSMR